MNRPTTVSAQRRTHRIHLAPYAGEPGLLLDGQARRAVVVLKFDEPGSRKVAAPSREIVVGAVALAVDVLLVVATGIRAEEHAGGLQRRVQLPQHTGQFLHRHMEQGCIGEHAVEKCIGQIQLQKILQPDFAPAVGTRHFGQCRRPFQTYYTMPALGECAQVAPGAATEVEYRERHGRPDVPQQRLYILGNVMIARAFPEGLGAAVVVLERPGDDLLQG